jgi:hypothetical protein
VLPPLSPIAQDFYDKMDVDGFYLEWQIPIVHQDAFRELVRKGYLIKATTHGSSADGKHESTLAGYEFAESVKSQLDDRMFR